jgi:hypothetical protein
MNTSLSDLSFRQFVSIHGVPRSGTSWLGQIFNSSPNVAFRFQPLFSYAFKGRLKPTSSQSEIKSFFHDIFHTKDEFVLQLKNISGNSEVQFSKNPELSHLVMKEVRYHYILENLLKTVPSVKIIGIVRNPCACINSWLRAPKEFHASWDQLKEWKYAPAKNLDRPEEFNGFAKWKELTEMFLRFAKDYPRNFRLVQYEHLNDNPVAVIRNLFDFSELQFTEQTAEFINVSRNTDSNDAYSVFRKAQANDNWKQQLNPVIAEQIVAELSGTELQQFLI